MSFSEVAFSSILYGAAFVIVLSICFLVIAVAALVLIQAAVWVKRRFWPEPPLTAEERAERRTFARKFWSGDLSPAEASGVNLAFVIFSLVTVVVLVFTLSVGVPAYYVTTVLFEKADYHPPWLTAEDFREGVSEAQQEYNDTKQRVAEQLQELKDKYANESQIAKSSYQEIKSDIDEAQEQLDVLYNLTQEERDAIMGLTPWRQWQIRIESWVTAIVCSILAGILLKYFGFV